MVVSAVAACTGGGHPAGPRPAVPDPAHTVPARPDYTQGCAPSGLDSSATCLELTLAAIDAARAREGVRPMVLPAGFDRLTVPEQLFVAIDRERADRGLRPFTALTAALDADAARGAASSRLPADPGSAYAAADTEWIGGIANGLDADYQWTYDDGPGSGVAGCGSHGGSGCWADRHIVLDDLATGTPVMGAALSPRADTTPDDKGGPSLGAVLATTAGPPTGSVDYTWAQGLAAAAQGTLRPRSAPPTDASATGIADPTHTLPPSPDYTRSCADTGLDSSPSCLDAVLAAIDHARSMEGVRPMTLPAGFGTLPVPEQVLAVVNLERIDRSLPPFAGLTAALDGNAQKGADTANDPPDPGSAYEVIDTEWAGGSVNGLDADYGWMYDDGTGSGNLDCPRAGAPGCWGHRHGILDNFGSLGTLVMGAAVNPTGDTTAGDRGGPSIAATLAVTTAAPGPFVYRWKGPAG
ncbi:MAG TPA: hypothetical protein VGI06_09200 [Acidimicrobiales bacterium]